MQLSEIFHPLGFEAFLEQHWERSPLVLSRGAPQHYRALYSTQDLSGLVWSAHPGWGEVQLANQVRGPGWVDFTKSAPDSRRLVQAYEQGDTIIYNHLEQRDPRIRALAAEFEGALHCHVNVNLYLTPPSAQGLPPHFDTQEVVVLQVEGAKRWRLFETPLQLPLPEQAGELQDKPDPQSAREIELRAGDLLYMPRGQVHEAITSDAASLHLTVTINPVTWRDLLLQLVTLASADDIALRRALPPGYLLRGEELAPAAAALLRGGAWEQHAGSALDAIARQLLGQLRALPASGFTEPAEELSLDTLLVRAEPGICHVSRGPQGAEIAFPGNRVNAPAPVARALRYVAERGELRPRELPNLSDSSRLVLARRLVREGLLRRATAAADPDARATGAPAER